jgi:hypothetical protein
VLRRLLLGIISRRVPAGNDGLVLKKSNPIPISMRDDEMALLMADPKPEEDDLAIPSFLDRRKPEPKHDRRAAMEKIVERKPLPVK